MIILPAIDLYEGKAVRLCRGDYDNMTVYSEHPTDLCAAFAAAGADFLHVVDLEGARDGTTPNIETVKELAETGFMKLEIGGGIRDEETVGRYLAAGAERVIIGTAAVTDPEFLADTVKRHGDKIAVGVDIKDGMAAIRGWREQSDISCRGLFDRLCGAGVKTVICTDISRDGMLGGANTELYGQLVGEYDINIIASGGVTTLEDIRALRDMGMYGAILGKAIYEQAIDLPAAVLCAAGRL